MRHIPKSLAQDQVPLSLRFPIPSNFPKKKVDRKAKTTHEKRVQVIQMGAYDKQFDDRYKTKDIRKALINLYFKKCAYCEQRVEQYHVEHYRPKKIYHWLAFSWDNLLYVCPFCNEYKDIQFEIQGQQVSITGFTLGNDINHLGSAYDAVELPLLVNPEVTNPNGHLEFHKDGSVTSADRRFDYTIRTCRISRTDLMDQRRKILDDFRKDLKEAVDSFPSKQERNAAVVTVMKAFKSRTEDQENPFLAFRHYVMQHWLTEELKAITQ